LRPALFDARSFFDKAWWSCQTGGQLDGLDAQEASNQTLTAALGVLTPLLGPGSRLPIEPDHALFCWDGKPKTEKPRPPKPAAFFEDLARFKQCLPALVGGCHVTAEWEADDAVATAAFKLEEAGTECVVVSADKDLHQLASRLVHYYCINKRTELTADDIRERWGVREPREVGLALALIGDKSDGIKGVYGIGPVKSKKLLAQLTSLDLLESVDQLAAMLDKSELDDFYESLDSTILMVNLPGIPGPEPIRLAPLDTLTELGLSAARLTWARLLGRCQLYAEVSSAFDESE
jgi:hypothetical protein